MPNAPASEINVLDQRHESHSRPGHQSIQPRENGRWTMHQVISGERTLTITVK